MNDRPTDEFDAVRIVVDLLKGFQPDEQARVLRWAHEKLNSVTPGSPAITSAGAHELTATLRDPEFLRLRNAVDKMLFVLAAAYRLCPQTFDKVLLIRGRNRRYFATSEAQIEESGKSTQPRKIPGTEYWVMTNSPTRQKRELLKQVLRDLGFSSAAVDDPGEAID